MLIYSDKATYTFLPFVSEKKLARRVPNVAFSMWSVWHGGRERQDKSLPPRDTRMFGRSARRDTKRPFGFFEEKGRAETPVSFSHMLS
jgi:hypothetical protein